jgi:hypothetical protein
MPITLGCPSCGKRFRARDESAGKRVKCPFCQAAVAVPSAEEAQNSSARTDEVPAMAVTPVHPVTPHSPAGKAKDDVPFGFAPTPPSSPSPVAPASPMDWGTAGLPPTEPLPPAAPRPAPAPPPARKSKADKASRPEPTSEEFVAASWRKTRSGLRWVSFALFWFALLGMVPFGKLVYERAVGPLPQGQGNIKIEGYVNDDSQDAFRISAEEEINLLLYGVPILLGGLAMILGRLTCGAAPRNSGAKGLFVFSGLFALIALTGLLTLPVAARAGYREIEGYARIAAIVCGAVAEFWFLLALGASAATLRRPKAVRMVGFFAFVIGLAALIVTIGWDSWLKYGVDLGRPKEPDADWLFYEAAAKMLGWILLIGVYSRAVSGVKRAIREFLEEAADRKAATAGR